MNILGQELQMVGISVKNPLRITPVDTIIRE